MFYHNFVDLCNKIGKSPSAAAEDMGFKRSVVTRWSKGSEPRQATLQKIADYFGVSVEELCGEQKEKPVPDNGNRLNPSYYELTPENRDLIDSMIEKLLKSQSGD